MHTGLTAPLTSTCDIDQQREVAATISHFISEISEKPPLGTCRSAPSVSFLSPDPEGFPDTVGTKSGTSVGGRGFLLVPEPSSGSGPSP